MKKESIMQYAKSIKLKYPNKSIIEIAKDLSYNVAFLDVDPKFILANTYRYGNGKKIIFINKHLNEKTKNILCAHELGHAILNHPAKNNFKDTNLENEYYANLFAVSLLFNENDFNTSFLDMSSYVLQTILDINIDI